MRKSKFSEEKIIGILREAEVDTPVGMVCARHNINQGTFYKWRSKYGGMHITRSVAPTASRLPTKSTTIFLSHYKFKDKMPTCALLPPEP